jgi:hypothetical protein
VDAFLKNLANNGFSNSLGIFLLEEKYYAESSYSNVMKYKEDREEVAFMWMTIRSRGDTWKLTEDYSREFGE